MENITLSSFLMLPRSLISNINFKNDIRLIKAYVFLYALARYKDTVIDGIPVKKYQILISKPKLAKELELTESEMRTILGKFEKMGAITRENKGNKYSLITLTEKFIKGEFPEYALFPAPKKRFTSELYEKYPEEEKKGKKAEKKEKIREASFNTAPASQNAKANKPGKETAEANKTQKNENTENIRDFALSNEEKAAAEKKRPYGRFKNVFLTDEEYKDLFSEIKNADFYINNLSASLMNNPTKHYPSHYALIYKNYINDADRNQKTKERKVWEPTPWQFDDRPPSYDLSRIEERALTSTPTLKKRRKPTEPKDPMMLSLLPKASH